MNIELIYPDGSCLTCDGLGSGDGVAFTPDSTLLSAATGVPASGTPFTLGLEWIDGTPDVDPSMLPGSTQIYDPTWSVQGLLAGVRYGDVWAGRPGHLRPFGRGGSPSWSPDGSRLAIARDGWVVIVRFKDHHARRLVKGGAPAWSPDGRSIAFIAANDRLSVVRASGGRVLRVRRIRALSVDWQPLPTTVPPSCDAPPGSQVIASSAGAEVISHPGPDVLEPGPGSVVHGTTYMGCLFADGRARTLEAFDAPTIDGAPSLGPVEFAGSYVALVNTLIGAHYGGVRVSVALFDLRTGQLVPDRGNEGAACAGYACDITLDQLVVGRDAVSAARITRGGSEPDGTTCTCTVEQIQASDSTGLHTLDSVTEPVGTPTVLTNLILTGDTLTWNDNGAPLSAQLVP